MKRLIIGVLIGVVLATLGFVLARRITNGSKQESVLPEQKVHAPKTAPSTEESEKSLAAISTAKTSDGQAVPGHGLATSSLAEQVKAYQRLREGLTSEEQKQKLEKLKHAVAVGSPELDVLEIRRDADVSKTRLLNKHAGKLYKYAGLILETTPHDITVVIKNTEIVSSFADGSWKREGLKPGGYLYACGFFESYEDRGSFQRISMADCYTIENFYELRTTPATEEERRQSLMDWQEDALYKVRRDLTRKLSESP